MRRFLTGMLLVSIIGFGAGALQSAPAAISGGPILLMGIDAEDGGPFGHGPPSVYIATFGTLLANTANGGTGILVIGGGKTAGDNVSAFWDTVGAGLPAPITYVNGAAAIAAVSFTGFKAIAVASSVFQTPGGGLTQDEDNALDLRDQDIADFVNNGGGLIGLSQDGLSPAYPYLDLIGEFNTTTGLSISTTTATPDGIDFGLNSTDLDVCCWHDEYNVFPDFLKILMTNDTDTKPIAIGGKKVIVPHVCDPTEMTIAITRPLLGELYVDDVDSGPSGTGDTVVKGSPLTITATTSNTAATDSVSFFVDEVPRGVDVSSPYSAVIDSNLLAQGTHTIRARVTALTIPCVGDVSQDFTIGCFNIPVTFTRPEAGRAYRNDLDIGESGTPEPLSLGGPLTVKADSADVAHTSLVNFSVDGGVEVPVAVGNPFITVIDTDPLVPGVHQISARVIEKNLNCSFKSTLLLRRPDPSLKAVGTGLVVTTNIPAEPIVRAGGATVEPGAGTDHIRIADRDVPGVVDYLHVITDDAAGENGDALNAHASSMITDVSLMGGMITADVLHAKSKASYDFETASASSSDDGSELLHLVIGGTPVIVNQPNTVVALPGGLGQVVLQETLTSTQGQRSETTVNMIHVFADTGTFVGEIVVGSAHAGVNLSGDVFTGPDNDLIHKPNDLNSHHDAPNTEAAAMAITPGIYAGSFTPGDTSDFYSFDTGQGERILAIAQPSEREIIQINPLPAVPTMTSIAPDLQLIIRDPDGIVRTGGDLATAGASTPERAELNADKPFSPAGAKARWTLEVRRGAGSPDGFYTLSFNLLPEQLMDQNDAGITGDAPDDCAAARDLGVTQTHAQEIDNYAFSGVIKDADVSDFYKVEAKIGQYLTIVVKPDELDDGADFDLFLYQPSSPGGPTDCSAPSGSSTTGKTLAKGQPDLVGTLPVKISGTYVFEVRRVNGVGNYYAEVNVTNSQPTISSHDAGLGTDAGDACADAVPIMPGNYQGSLLDTPKNDLEDWYSFTVTGAQDVQLVALPITLSKTVFTLYQSDCSTEVAPTTPHVGAGEPTAFVIHDSAATTYKLRVSREDGQAGGNYTIVLSVTP